MGIELSTQLDSLILIFGGVLIFILGFVFFQLASLQKTGTGTAVASSKNLVKNKAEKPTKREKEGTVKHEQVRLVKAEGEQPVQRQKQEPLKSQKEKLEKQQNDGRSSFINKLFKSTTRKGAKPDEAVVGIGTGSRMPKLSSLGIKEGKPNSEISDAEAKAMVMDINLTANGTNLAAGVDVISAMAAVVGQGGTTTTPKDVVPAGLEITPVSPPPIIPATVAPPPVPPPAVKPAPVQEVPKEEKKEEKSDRVRDMFANDDVEESESNKVAKDLEQVDIQDLLTESQTLINSFVQRGK